MNKLIVVLSLIITAFTASYADAISPQIIGPYMKVIDNNIIVSLSIYQVTELAKSITSGVEKEITFTIELLRAWRFWPDEFIVSKKVSRVIKYDNLRGQYRVISYDGVTRTEKYYNDYHEIKDWIFNVSNINLANIKELEPDRYYIRTVVESKSLEQPPLIGFLIHFIPEVEMSLAKESQLFMLGEN
ncbi:MAG: DUF4390 domain-containing protein [Nitrospiraceae bacterium]|nr:MAG: DUF4390 domain-containing protein [Nitrospiraceae bacterium]